MALPRVNVLNVGVSAVNMEQALTTIDEWIERRERHYVCITGVHGVMESQRDPDLRRIHNDAGMVTPDGMPLVWLSHRHGYRHVTRVYGPDLMLAECRRSVKRGHRHFFFGGADGVPERLADRLSTKFPGLEVAGIHSPPFRPLSPEEDTALIDEINAARPDIVWVGLSTPKQERWMNAHLGRIEAPVMIGVGAAFDFHAGLKKQAPLWMQRSGLEWSFRLLTEPRRLWKRYLVNNPAFVYRVARQAMAREQAGLTALDLADRSASSPGARSARLWGRTGAGGPGSLATSGRRDTMPAMSAAPSRRWSADRKTEVVLEILANRISQRRACSKYGIEEARLQRWTARFLEGAESALHDVE